MRILAWLEQIVGTVTLLVIPIWWPDKLALAKIWPFFAYNPGDSWYPNWAAIGFTISAGLLVFGQWSERRYASKEEVVLVDDHLFIAAYATAVKDSIKTASVAHKLDPGQRVDAQKKILAAIATIVHFYHDNKEGLEINACNMVAYGADKVPADVAGRVTRFTEKKRPLNTYPYVLDLTVWAKGSPDVPKSLSLPVEDAEDHDMRLKLLPGAPAAFALRKVQVIESTDNLSSYFKGPGRGVDFVVKEEQLKYFREQGFKSFASIPIEREGDIIGVLNVQSNKTRILGRKNKHMQSVTDLLEPLRHALSLLI